MRFTDRWISALKPKSQRYEVWEPGRTGLGVRVSPHGRKSWVYMYRHDGRPRRMTLGSYPAMGLADARLEHAKARKKLERGIDPGTELVGERRADRAAQTVDDLADEYLMKWARPHKRSAAEDERILRKDVLPHWGRQKARDITRRDVITLLDRIVERGSPIAANRTLAVVRRMFNFAVARDILDATPVAMVRAPSPERQRERVLSAAEIKTLWNGLDGAPISEAVRLAVRLQLVTAQRKGEVVGAALGEFDLSEAVWTIPAERAKNGRIHRVPLSPLAVRLVERAIEVGRVKQRSEKADKGGGPEWLLPSPRPGRPISPEAVNHGLYKSLPKLGLEDMTPHDLRRSAASYMTALGFTRLVVGKILNHADQGVTAVYDRYAYAKEMRRALDAWAQELEGMLEDKAAANVVALPTGAKAR